MPESGSPSTDRLLNVRQRKLVGFTFSFLALVTVMGLLALLFVLLARLVGYFSDVLWPITTAGIMALVLRPVVDVLEHRTHRPRVTSVIILYALVSLLLSAGLLWLIPKLVSQILDFIAFAPDFWHRASTYVQTKFPDWVSAAQQQMENPSIKSLADTALSELQHLLSRALPSILAAGSGAMNVFGFFTSLAIIPIYLFFFLLSRRDPSGELDAQLSFLDQPVRQDVVFLVREFIAIVVSFFRGQLLIGLLMGLMLTMGFAVVGLRFALILGLTLGVLNIVPYLGTIVGLSIALPLAFFQPGGGWSLVAAVVIVFVVVQNIEGWFLTPKIMGDRTGLHPVMIMFAIFFWGTAFDGILGMILAIPLTAFFVTAWRLAKQKYLTPDRPALAHEA